MRERKILLCAATWISVLIGQTSCGLMKEQAKSISSGYIGCPPENVVISDLHVSVASGKTWVATCNGQQMRCFERCGQSEGCTSHCASEVAVPKP